MSLDEQKPLVSVIIPVHNRGYVLARTVASVLGQTHQNIECIIVDDASADNTEEIGRSFKDPRVRYIRQAENKGAAVSRNIGIKASQGDFLTFLDSDDEYLPEKIERSLDTFKSISGHVGMVVSNYFYVSFSGKKKNFIDGEDPNRVFPHVSTWVIRREVVDKIGLFDERIVLSEEVDFFQRFRKKFSLYFIEEPLVNVYESKDGFFSDPEKVILIRKKYLEKLRGNRRLYALHLKYLAKDFRYIGKEKETGECYLKAFYAYPVNVGYFIEFIKSCLKRR
jgi:glycosyltransferase involved in cell wall biosynthesis